MVAKYNSSISLQNKSKLHYVPRQDTKAERVR